MDQGNGPTMLRALIPQWRGRLVVVAGDIMLDRYSDGVVSRLSPEAPVPVLDVRTTHETLGGAGGVIANLRGLGLRVAPLCVIGTDEAGEALRARLAALDVATDSLCRDPSRPTTLKHRMMQDGVHMMRADHESRAPIDAALTAKLLAYADAALSDAAALILSDYQKGVLHDDLCAALIERACARDLPVMVDPKGHDYARYRGATLVTPNRAELAQACGMDDPDALVDDVSIEQAARRIIEKAGIGAVVATRSEQGMSVIAPPHAPLHLPARATHVAEVSGAGDTVIASLCASLVAGADLAQAATLANHAAAIVVAQKGTSAITAEILDDALATPIFGAATASVRAAPALSGASAFESPFTDDWDSARALIEQWRAAHLQIGFTNGCFDILHPGHVGYLAQARARCQRLVVGLNADSSVRRLKGAERPVNDERARAAVLAGLGAVDLVVLFGQNPHEDDKPVKLVEYLRPDIFFKGGDYQESQLPEAASVRAYGGQVCIMNLFEGHSTTAIIGRARQH